MICPKCQNNVESNLDTYWLTNYGQCAECDRKEFTDKVLEGYNEAPTKVQDVRDED